MCFESDTIREERLRNKEIDKEIREASEKIEREAKILLLGTGESGKSTILKQMVLIHGKGYKLNERILFKHIIFQNIISAMISLLDSLLELQLFLKEENKSQEVVVRDSLKSYQESESWAPNESFVEAILQLWNDPAIQTSFSRSTEFQLNDSAKYFISSIIRISIPDYIPTEQDILRCRAKTTGIVETRFEINSMIYRIFDMGGQRSERRKWVHCFENVTAILFLTAISEFDQVLAEDDKMNRMVEALSVFGQTCSNQFFKNSSIILFFNKIDLLKTKLEAGVLFSNSFPEYKGDNSYEKVSLFIKKMFHSLHQMPDKQLYSHFTCATDTSQVKVVLHAVTDTILKNCIKDLGFL